MRPKQRSTQQLIEVVGWLGVVLIVMAYILLSTGVITGRSAPYQLLMLIGSASIAYEAWIKKDKQPMVLNLVFMTIAFISLLELFVKQ